MQSIFRSATRPILPLSVLARSRAQTPSSLVHVLDSCRPNGSAEYRENPAALAPEPTGGWLHTDLTLAAGAPEAAAGDPVVASWPDGKLCVLYLGVDHHIHVLRLSDDGIHARSGDTGALPA